jgi:methyltransferase (TIGR00027 family)
MKDGRPSFTAAIAAIARSWGDLLPEDARLCHDPFGARFGGPVASGLARAALRLPSVSGRILARARTIHRLVLWMQVRTRFFDDQLLAFARAGGRQVLLLGAGFDCRAARFARELEGVTIYEVDHPATQAEKRRTLARAGAPSARVAYVAWDFHEQPTAELPGCLARHGHDPAQPTLTIWEGVTMYLAEEAIEASVAAVRDLSAPGSRLAFTYHTRAVVEGVRAGAKGHRTAGGRTEPIRFGWDPATLPAWLAARGFCGVEDHVARDLVRRSLPGRYLPLFVHDHRIAVATRAGRSEEP